jgi:hypothetical protein
VISGNRSGLTDAEASLLKQVAASCRASLDAQSQAGAAIVNQLRTSYPKRSDLPPSAVQRIDALQAERERISSDCIQRLQNGMGTARFQRLYTFVRRTEAGSIKQSPKQAPASAAQAVRQ